MSFADLGVSAPVVGALTKRGITAPFAVQQLVIEDVLAGRDVLVQSPTGSGKTLAFGIPLVDLVRPGRPQSALILAPTRELAVQIVEELAPLAASRDLSIAPVYGGVALDRQAKRARRADILVATPGRLEDFIDRGDLSLDRVQLLVIDEADRMLDMGFKPAVDRIVAQTARNRQTLFFSATLESAAGQLARAYTRDAVRHVNKPKDQAAAKVSHRFVHVEHADKLDALVAELNDVDATRSLVFVRTKRGADRLVKRLASRNVSAAAMHGDKTQGQRQRALANFAGGRIDTLVATDVAARGIDVDAISHVVNFDAPADRETYVHRTGRTGRASAEGSSVTFVIPDQHADMRAIAKHLGLLGEFEGQASDRYRPHSGGRDRSAVHPGRDRQRTHLQRAGGDRGSRSARGPVRASRRD